MIIIKRKTRFTIGISVAIFALWMLGIAIYAWIMDNKNDDGELGGYVYFMYALISTGLFLLGIIISIIFLVTSIERKNNYE